MRSTSVTTGSSVQTLLMIVVLCGIIALVPALAAGVKHAGALLRMVVAGDGAATARVLTVEEAHARPGRALISAPAAALQRQACPGSARFCRA